MPKELGIYEISKLRGGAEGALMWGPSHSEGVTRYKAFALNFLLSLFKNQLGEKKRQKRKVISKIKHPPF